MAVLSDQDRFDLWAEFMRRAKELGIDSIPVLKTELRAAFNAADDWSSTNSTSYNTALPQPARGALPAAAKALILKMVIERRWKIGA